MTGSYSVSRKPLRPRKPKTIIPANLRDVYAGVVAKAVELRARGLTRLEVCDELKRQGFRTRTGKELGHAQQIIKLLRSFGNGV
jgi:hypothetical protein